MFLDHTSYLDLYFYAERTRGALEEHRAWLNGYLTNSMGSSWFEDLSRDIHDYRSDFDGLLRDRSQTSEAVANHDQMMARVATWRSMMTSMARQAPVARRKVLLQAAGHGLGSPHSVKEMKVFLVEVKARLNLHGDAFVGLGALNASLRFPSLVLADLERASNEVAWEKAEDGITHARLYELHTSLVDRLEKLGHAASAAASQGELLGDDAMARSGEALLLHLTQALAEARVEARRKCAGGEVPVEMMVENTTIASTGEVLIGPDSEVTGEVVVEALLQG